MSAKLSGAQNVWARARAQPNFFQRTKALNVYVFWLLKSNSSLFWNVFLPFEVLISTFIIAQNFCWFSNSRFLKESGIQSSLAKSPIHLLLHFNDIWLSSYHVIEWNCNVTGALAKKEESLLFQLTVAVKFSLSFFTNRVRIEMKSHTIGLNSFLQWVTEKLFFKLVFFAYISVTTWSTKKLFNFIYFLVRRAFRWKKTFKIRSQNQLIFAKTLFCQKNVSYLKKSAIQKFKK